MSRVLIVSLAFIVMHFSASARADNILKRLEVQVTQSGFAGESGTLWTIEPSGKWSRQEIVGSQVQPVDNQNTGVLTSDQLARLKQAMHQNNIATLPERLGSASRANPRKLVIKWGDKKIEVVTPPSVDPTIAAPSATNSSSGAPEQQAAAIAQMVKDLTKN